MRRMLTLASLIFLTSCDRADVTQPSAVVLPSETSTQHSLEVWVSDTAGRMIEGATGEIVSGALAGRTFVTDHNGRYLFPETFAVAPTMRVSKPGYVPFDNRVSVAFGTTTIRATFRLGSLNPPLDLGGSYVVTFTADPACTSLPDAARVRRYIADFPAGPWPFHVLPLRGATFVPGETGYNWHTIYISIFENFVRMNFSDPPIWELLKPPASIYLYGSAQGAVTGDDWTLPMSGAFEYCGTTTGGRCERETQCESRRHTVAFSRR